MSKEIQQKINPFVRIQAEYVNWTGYDANLLDQACERGLALEAENEKFRKISPQRAREQFWSRWGAFGKVLTSCFAVGILIFLFAWMITATHGWSKYEEGMKASQEKAVAAAVAFVEAQYRHVDPSQIRLEFPNGADVLDRSKWIDARTGSYTNTTVISKQYDEILKNGAYKIFVNQK